MSDALDPCPFCGGDAHVTASAYDPRAYVARCWECEASLRYSARAPGDELVAPFRSREQAVAAWNKRTP